MNGCYFRSDAKEGLSEKLTTKPRAECSEGESTSDAEFPSLKLLKTCNAKYFNKFSGGFPSAKLKAWTNIFVNLVL